MRVFQSLINLKSELSMGRHTAVSRNRDGLLTKGWLEGLPLLTGNLAFGFSGRRLHGRIRGHRPIAIRFLESNHFYLPTKRWRVKREIAGKDGVGLPSLTQGVKHELAVRDRRLAFLPHVHDQAMGLDERVIADQNRTVITWNYRAVRLQVQQLCSVAAAPQTADPDGEWILCDFTDHLIVGVHLFVRIANW